MILCEGSDLTGKSTLVKAIAAKFDIPRTFTGAPTEGRYEFDIARETLAVHKFRNDLVIDRAVLSNEVYFDLMHRGLRNTEAMFSRFLDFLYQTQSLVIFAQATDDTLIKRYHWRGDPHPEINVQTLPRISAAYRKVMVRVMASGVKTLTYQSDETRPADWLERHASDLSRALNPLRSGTL